MPKITLIGAGSAVFARQIITDILHIDGLDEGTFALVDIDPQRLDLARRIAQRLIESTGKRWQVTAATERRAVLHGSDFIVNSVEVAGLPNVRHDYEIPLKYGVDQCIGDTIGPGGIFKALRTGPVWLDILRDAERLCHRPGCSTTPIRCRSSLWPRCRVLPCVRSGCATVCRVPRRRWPGTCRCPMRRWSGSAPASTIMPGSPCCAIAGRTSPPAASGCR